MDNIPAQQPVAKPDQATKGFIKPVLSTTVGKFLLLLILVLLALWYLVFVDNDNFLGKKVKRLGSQIQEPVISQSELPISIDLLKNRSVQQWRGSINGKLVAKDDQSITIADNEGNSLTIPTRYSSSDKQFTMFFMMDEQGQATPGTIALDGIPLGATLHGDFFVFSGGKKIVGGQFVYDKRFSE